MSSRESHPRPASHVVQPLVAERDEPTDQRHRVRDARVQPRRIAGHGIHRERQQQDDGWIEQCASLPGNGLPVASEAITDPEP